MSPSAITAAVRFMPSRIKPVGVHIVATAGLAPTAPASATPVISNKATVFFIYFLPGSMAETTDRSGPVAKRRTGEDVPPRLLGIIVSQILRLSTLASTEYNVLTGTRIRNLEKRGGESESQI